MKQLFRMLTSASALVAATLAANAQSRPPWPAGDEIGMANTLGPATWQRCAPHLANPQREVLRAVVRALEHHAAIAVRGAAARERQADGRHPGHAPCLQHRRGGERRSRPAGHADGCARTFRRAAASRGTARASFPSGRATYYGGYTQQQVKPTPDSPLQKLGIDKVPPIVTTAVLLDAKTHLGKRQADGAGRARHRRRHRGDAEGAGAGEPRAAAGRRALHLHRLGRQLERPRHREVLLHQGAGPRLRRAPSTSSRRQSCWSRSTIRSPIRSPTASCRARRRPRPARRPALPFAIHHHNLVEAGIHNIQNANLGALARDKVWLSCTIILPLRTQGASGSPVRPVAIGAPAQ